MAQRLHRNHGGYHGETIDIARVLAAADQAARRRHWRREDLMASPALHLPVFQRAAATVTGSHPARRIYLSAGIHGDEPAGLLAIQSLLEADAWSGNAEWCILPCLNPTGFLLNHRENAAGKDLNRDYRHQETDEVRAHIAWLEQQPAFDVAFCLHEDWEAHGFYVYELNPEDRPSLAPDIVKAVKPVCPIDPSEVIEGRPASGGIIRPDLNPASRPQWPEAFWLLQHKTRLSYTLEAPSDYPLATRVAALVAGVNAALASFLR